jgi:hypothetical protein
MVLSKKKQKRIAYARLAAEEKKNNNVISILKDEIEKSLKTNDQQTQRMLMEMLHEEKLKQARLERKRKKLGDVS